MHLKLRDHNLEELVKYVQQGYKLETHDDVPEEIRVQLYAEDQQGRKRKRQYSGLDRSYTPVVSHNYMLGQALVPADVTSLDQRSCVCARQPPLCIPRLREDAIKGFHEWHRLQVRTETQKDHHT